MKFGMHRFAQQVADTVEIVDPWGQDLRLTIYRRGARALRKKERQAQLRNPVIVRALNAAVKAQFSGRREDMETILQREAESLDLTADQLTEMLETRVREAAELIVDWSGAAVVDTETGQPIPCTLDAKLELLDLPDAVPDGEPYGGQSLGDALVQWIHESAEGAAAERQEYVIAAGKGSGDTPAGASAPGPTIPESGAL